MSEYISMVTTPFNFVTKLHEMIRRYQKKKKTEGHFISAFESEIKAYKSVLEQISDNSERQIMPILESIEGELTVHKMNELLGALSVFPLYHARLIEAFIGFAKACNEASDQKGFMDDLKTTNVALYDFVCTMKNTYVEPDRVQIDGRFYRFFKIYKGEMFKEVGIRDVEEDIADLKGYVRKIKHYLRDTSFILYPLHHLV